MKRILKGFVASAIIATAVMVTGCHEDTIIKSNLVPGADTIGLVQIPDTLTMSVQTVIVDTLNTSANIANQPVIHAAGTIVDPVLGRTTAGIFLQVLPTTNQFSFPGTVDSAFLILPYTRVSWGDTLKSSTQTLTVRRTDETLDKSTTYYSKDFQRVSETISDPFTFNADPKKLSQPVKVMGIDRSPHLRIPLKLGNWFEEIRTQAPDKSTTTEFLQLIRGLYVEADPKANSSSLPYFFLDGINDYERAAIQFFYKDSKDTVRSVFFNFVRGECAHFNYITRDVDVLDAKKDAGNKSGETVYLQNEPGAAIDITLPYIQNLPLGIINSAILEITQVTAGLTREDDVNYTAPTRLVPYVVASDGSVAIADEASGQLGGNRETFSLGGLEFVRYRINIANTIQKAITGKWNMLHLRILGAKGFPAAYRLVAGGRNHPDPMLRTQLKIFYSKPQ